MNNNPEEKTIKLTVSELTDASVAEITLQKAGTASVKSGEGLKRIRQQDITLL